MGTRDPMNNRPIGQDIIVVDLDGTAYTAETFYETFLPDVRKAVWTATKRTYSSYFTHEDVIQDAMMRCLQNAYRYDTVHEIPVKQYVYLSAIGHAKRYLRDHSHDLHVTRSVKECSTKLFKLYDMSELHHITDYRSIAEATGFSENIVRETLRYISEGRNPISMSIPVGEDGNITVEDLIPAPDDEDDFYYLKNLATHYLEHDATERERILISGKFMNVSQTQLAEVFGFSQNHISRLQRKAIDRMRDVLQKRRKQYE